MSRIVKLSSGFTALSFGYQEIERLFCKKSEKIAKFRKVVQVVRFVSKQYCTTSGSTGTPKVVRTSKISTSGSRILVIL
jgi:hypothetical protein